MSALAPVLVTGASGSIGAVLVRRLSEAGQTVRALVRSPERSPRLRALAHVQVVAGDLTHPESLPTAAAGCARWCIIARLRSAAPVGQNHGLQT